MTDIRKSGQEPKVAIDGLFLCKQINGVPRYAREMVKALDAQIASGEMELIAPASDTIRQPLVLSHIRQTHTGNHCGQLWEQFELPGALRSCNAALELYLCNSMPIHSKRGVVVIHDIAPLVHPEFYSRKIALYSGLMMKNALSRARHVVTDSGFSKAEILRRFPSVENRISVIACAWQHIEACGESARLLDRLSLEPKSFYFSISSITPNKNLRWIVETARRNPRETFLVAGGIDKKVFAKSDIPEVENVRYLGYVTDEEAKTLFKACKAFIFPTFYEGFGIPPLEALACGANIIVSDTPVMHEIYGNAASYIDPHIPCDDIASCTCDRARAAKEILGRYSWDKSAASMRTLLNEMGDE